MLRLGRLWPVIISLVTSGGAGDGSRSNSNPVQRFNELPDETQEFLSELRGEDIATLKDGLRLVLAMRTVGRLVRWVIVGFVGAIIGAVVLYENIMKIVSWIGANK